LWMLNPLALLHAMAGDFARADAVLREADETRRKLGGPDYSVSHMAADVRMLAGRPDLAAVPLRMGIEKLAGMGDGRMLATTRAMLARAAYAQGDVDEARRLCRQTAAGAADDDIVTGVIWRGVEARILARDGRADDAERLAREALALIEPTDLLSHHGDAMLDVAAVLRACGRHDEEQEHVRDAVALYEAKGNVAAAAKARAQIAATPPDGER
jgi:ATP/maltotriose-dependent transcriptional regulator MalT